MAKFDPKRLKPSPDFLVIDAVRKPQMMAAQLNTAADRLVRSGVLQKGEADAITKALSSGADITRNVKSAVERLAAQPQASPLVKFIAVNLGTLAIPGGGADQTQASTIGGILGAAGMVAGAAFGALAGDIPGAALGGAIGKEVGEAIGDAIDDSLNDNDGGDGGDGDDKGGGSTDGDGGGDAGSGGSGSGGA